jgi:hypothetical protein
MTNPKFQIISRNQFRITQTFRLEFGLLSVGIYLLFGAWDLVLIFSGG